MVISAQKATFGTNLAAAGHYGLISYGKSAHWRENYKNTYVKKKKTPFSSIPTQ
jgi:hypothetical protein